MEEWWSIGVHATIVPVPTKKSKEFNLLQLLIIVCMETKRLLKNTCTVLVSSDIPFPEAGNLPTYINMYVYIQYVLGQVHRYIINTSLL